MPSGRNDGRPSTSSPRLSSSFSFDFQFNEPVRVYPFENDRNKSLAALQSLQNKNVAIVGLLSSSSSSSSRAFAFANRIIGRCVFREDVMQNATTVQNTTLPASIHLYYDDVTRCIYLLGLARPDRFSYSTSAVSKTETLNKNIKNKSLARRQSTAGNEAEEQPLLSEVQRMRIETDAYEREMSKMQVLLYSSCNLLIVLKETARVTSNVLKDIRALAVEKAQLQSVVATSTKHPKRENFHLKGSSLSSLSTAGNGFAPGRCVPMVVFVVPAPDEMLQMSQKTQSSGSTRSATITCCKSLEARLTTLFRSLRGGTVGTLRMRDALSAANLSKERRLFNIDPAHCVVVVSKRTVTTEGRVEVLLENFLSSLDSNVGAQDVLNDESLLQPLVDDDIGFVRLNQYVQKFLDQLFAFSPSTGKDGGRNELLSPPQWLKAFFGLMKSYNRLQSKKRQEGRILDTDFMSDYTVSPSLAMYPSNLMDSTR
ncbi:uncharacterized protein PHALS_08336 [Plasmopara halstedii]|uniref:Nonsense-mediated mRNA decay factor SMG8 n=1 Tax=Plasmopara halstedii TaxID=4781 RepID=A0A0N7L4C0_PLAHL|nr:uncharacterized protein PHALS_08336 [Plasmopara halstedii]CEG38251.1 hypothetical protein PHALS_08336 [Plasmopara halstedii]|eukprot:XP_024574620.1 hypothetical protein PHALS_08336 [Plasmopara halstedii]